MTAPDSPPPPSTPKVFEDDSHAFVARFDLPPSGSGPLDGLTFAVKDLIDVAGYVTGCGNPSWAEGRPVAATHAVCVDQLLAAGARCVGKTMSDEMAFSLIGENVHYGTPLNPRAPDRVPGGSSSGSASAVACGLCDFALGTDTGGSVRVPAANCGIHGFRPSHGRISVAGVNPFAPGFDTVGVLARSFAILSRAMNVLLGQGLAPRTPSLGTIHLVDDAFTLADPDIQALLNNGPLARLAVESPAEVRSVTMGQIMGDDDRSGLDRWRDTYNTLQWAEIWSTLGTWIEARSPTFGPIIAEGFARTRGLDRRTIAEMVVVREAFARRIDDFLGPKGLLCLPTTPTVAPRKGEIRARSLAGGDYYPRALALTSLAGIGRLPQVTVPVARLGGAPVGLSFLAGHGRDADLLETVGSLAPHLVSDVS